jgi:hypothetical protein
MIGWRKMPLKTSESYRSVPPCRAELPRTLPSLLHVAQWVFDAQACKLGFSAWRQPGPNGAWGGLTYVHMLDVTVKDYWKRQHSGVSVEWLTQL